jgi:homocysteine S-methyltransferase
MLEPALARAAGERARISDGGTGTELRRRGFALRPDVWSALASLEAPDLLRSIHADYIAAGADLITTNTFATSRFVLDGAGLGARFETLNRRAVAIAREARDAAGKDTLIAGSISCLPPRFDVAAYPAAADERAAYRELAELLADTGVDVLALEMLEDTTHAVLACEAARDVGLPLWLGVSCRYRAESLVAFDFPDTPLAAVLDAVLPFAPDLVAVMHSPLGAIEPALAALRARFPGPLAASPEIGDGTPGRAPLLQPTALAAAARGWVAAGASWVGGCCGTTPAHIAAVAQRLGIELPRAEAS